MSVTGNSAPACQVGVPGVIPGKGPGWYLVAANRHVEAGPFASQEAAEDGAEWMQAQSLGVNPYPWTPTWSPKGMTIGTRIRASPEARARSVGAV